MPNSQPIPKQEVTSRKQSECISRPSSDIEFKVNYPEENPESCIDDITDTMKHIGIFDGITQ
ncbi:hypothetical protein IT413_03430 [Candidatus Peregrinibacteria bacterium]|nr:hypothetical protein [Candidatus Peregrinibacteria bacterium]